MKARSRRPGRSPIGCKQEVRLITVGQLHLPEPVNPFQTGLDLVPDGVEVVGSEPGAKLSANHFRESLGQRARVAVYGLRRDGWIGPGG